MAKKFMFVCFGILALAAAYAVGASNSVAQVGGSDTVVASYYIPGSVTATVAVTANGDHYAHPGYILSSGGGTPHWSHDGAWTYLGNVFTGSVSAQPNSLGGVKSLFR